MPAARPRSRRARDVPSTRSGSSMSCSASNSGRRYGSTFAIRSPGQEAEPLAGLDRGAGEDDPVDLAPAERGRRERDREERLAGAGGADPERDRVVADRVDVALLVDGLRRDLGRAVAPDDVLEDLRRRLVRVERAASPPRSSRARSRGPARSARTARARRPPPRRPRRRRPRASARCRAGTRRSRGAPRASAARHPAVPASSAATVLSSSSLLAHYARRAPPHTRRGTLAVGAAAGRSPSRPSSPAHVLGARSRPVSAIAASTIASSSASSSSAGR